MGPPCPKRLASTGTGSAGGIERVKPTQVRAHVHPAVRHHRELLAPDPGARPERLADVAPGNAGGVEDREPLSADRRRVQEALLDHRVEHDHLASLDLRAQLSWVWDFANAIQKYKDSPKWPTLGKAMTAEPERPWLYPDVDTYVIALWPFVKKYNWTYRDLLNVIRPALKRPDSYPCDTNQDFAAYCLTVLGLRKSAKGVTANDAKPAGHEIAMRLCPELEKKTSKS